MEQVNKVVLVGLVGRTRDIEVGGMHQIEMLVSTMRQYTNADGVCIIKTTWTCVRYVAPSALAYKTGDAIRVFGSLESRSVIGDDGESKLDYYIHPHMIERVHEEVVPAKGL